MIFPVPKSLKLLAESVNNIKHLAETDSPKLYLVGGAIRDILNGSKPKDYDLCLTGFTTMLQARDFLIMLGDCIMVGLNMPVFRFSPLSHLSPELPTIYEIALARIENSQDFSSYNDIEFVFEVDGRPVTILEDLERRDITQNSMALDFLTAELIDPFGGYDDIKNGIIRATNLGLFKTSIERPLRIGTVLARDYKSFKSFDTEVDTNLVSLCREMRSHAGISLTHHQSRRANLSAIPREQLWLQFEKALVSPRFDKFIEWLREIGWVNSFIELKELIGCPQDPKQHPEGDVWNHTLHTIREMQLLINNRTDITDDERKVLLLAALCHDMDKPIAIQVFNENKIELANTFTTVIEFVVSREYDPEKHKITNHRHDYCYRASDFLSFIGCTIEIIDRVSRLCKSHMDHLNFTGKITKRQIARLMRRIAPSTIDKLYLLMKADHFARPPLPKVVPNSIDDMINASKEIKLDDDNKPYCPIQGRHLIRWGLSESGQGWSKPYFGDPDREDTIIGIIYLAQLDGFFGDHNSPDPHLVEKWVRRVNWSSVFSILHCNSDEVLKQYPKEVIYEP